MYREQHALSVFVFNRYTGIYLYIATEEVLNVCTDESSSSYVYKHTARGWKKLMGLDYVGVSVLLECAHLIQ